MRTDAHLCASTRSVFTLPTAASFISKQYACRFDSSVRPPRSALARDALELLHFSQIDHMLDIAEPEPNGRQDPRR
jgi:hypothetical protein